MNASIKPRIPMAMWFLLGASGLAALLMLMAEGAQAARREAILFNTGMYADIYIFDQEQKMITALSMAFSLISIALYLATVFSVAIRKFVLAICFAPAAIAISTFPVMAITDSWRIPGFTDLINQGGFLNVVHFLVNYPGNVNLPGLLLGFLFYPLVLISAFAAFSLAKSKQQKGQHNEQ